MSCPDDLVDHRREITTPGTACSAMTTQLLLNWQAALKSNETTQCRGESTATRGLRKS